MAKSSWVAVQSKNFERTPPFAFLGNANHRYRMLDWFGRLKQPTYNKSAGRCSPLGFFVCNQSRNLCLLVTWATLHYLLDWFGGNKQTHYSCQQLELSLRLHLFVYVLPVQTQPYFFRRLSNDDDQSIDIN